MATQADIALAKQMTTPGGGYAAPAGSLLATQIQAMLNPGVLKTGAVSGTTPLGQGMPIQNTNYQAITGAGAAENAAFGALQRQRAAEATQLTQNKQSELAKQGNVVSSYYDAAQGKWVQSPDSSLGYKVNAGGGYDLVTPPKSAAQTALDAFLNRSQSSTGNVGTLSSSAAQAAAGAERSAQTSAQTSADKFYSDLMTRLDTRGKETQQMLQDQADIASRKLAASQAGEEATAKASQFKLGRTETAQGVAEMQGLHNAFRMEMADSQLKYNNLMIQARQATEEGQIALAKEYRTFAAQEQQLALQKQQAFLQADKYQRETASKTFEVMAQSGYTPDETYLSAVDKRNNWDAGTAAILYQAQVKSSAIATKKDMTEQLARISTIRKNTPFGQSFTVGDNTYWGTDTDNVEIDKNTGMARMLYLDANNKPAIKEIGQLGGVAPQDLEQRVVGGILQWVDKNSGLVVGAGPRNGGVGGSAGLDTLFPTGTKGGQCGEAIHGVCPDYPYGLNSKAERLAAVNIPKGSTPSIGNVLFQDIGDVGHSAVVTYVGADSAGKQFMTVSDSNRAGDGKWQHGKVIYLDDPTIMGYRDTKLYPEIAQTLGLDGKVAENFQRTTGGLTVKSSSPFIIEGANATSYASGMQKENEAQTGADQIMSGDITDPNKQISDFSIRSRAVQIARDNGYIPAGSGLSQIKETFYEFVKNKEKELVGAGALMSPDDKSLRAEYDARNSAFKAFDAAIRNQAAGITPERFKTFTKNVQDAVQSGDFETAKDRLVTGAFRGEQVAQRKDWESTGRFNAAIKDISSLINEVNNAGKTGLLKGGFEKAAQALGETSDPYLASLGSRMQAIVNDYRYGVSGAAFTASEAAMYEKMLPSVMKGNELNNALISGFTASVNRKRDQIMRETLGNEAVDLFNKKIKVLNRETDKQETIPLIRFDSATYKAL